MVYPIVVGPHFIRRNNQSESDAKNWKIGKFSGSSPERAHASCRACGNHGAVAGDEAGVSFQNSATGLSLILASVAMGRRNSASRSRFTSPKSAVSGASFKGE